eukprot:281877-Rhodomonas_salina.8
MDGKIGRYFRRQHGRWWSNCVDLYCNGYSFCTAGIEKGLCNQPTATCSPPAGVEGSVRQAQIDPQRFRSSSCL